jgi:16S rRNA (guanine966-N2)-methyltransferase
VRIIGGVWRRRRIAIPEGVDLRPTPDRVRETLFNWLDPVLSGAVCLDLFAGTGALGFEALSRGAARAVLVERDRQVADALERVRDELEAAAEIVRDDAMEYLARGGGPYDLVFIDPPYAESVEDVLDALRQWLGPTARIYLERERGASWPELEWLEWSRRGKAGGVAFGLGELAKV